MVQAQTIFLLLLSNVFMTFAWYGHLKFKTAPIVTVVLVSWLIAFFEYCLQVPANRMGAKIMSAAQLKAIQEVLTLGVFVVFSIYYLKQPISWNILAGFVLIGAGALLIFKPWAG